MERSEIRGGPSRIPAALHAGYVLGAKDRLVKTGKEP
jgi:hypothetical protein